MRLVSFNIGGRKTFGALVRGGVVDLGARLGGGVRDLGLAIANGQYVSIANELKGAPADYTENDIVFDPVIRQPGKILCVGLNYEDHRRETGRPEAKYPAIFTRFADTQTGHLQPLIKPNRSSQFDYEGELAVVIGRAGRYIEPRDARGHILGYSCYNDASVRDYQHHTHQFTPGKNFPGTGAFGPALVTADEITELGSQRIQTRLNGQVVQDAALGQMIFSIERLIAYISEWTLLSPGDVIITGTPGGVGAKRTPPLFMKHGDEVVVEIEQVGSLSNTVRDEGEREFLS
jgi:2-keto-4-pentenoate hydratase/2-oxohepta-3-ene-1,7-dioic acid hydratase in catechol pathway